MKYGGLAALIGAALPLAAALPAAAAEHKVTMDSMRYAPATLQAKVGDTIKFVNDDSNNHVVFVPTRGFGVDLGAQPPGQDRELTLYKPGRFEVECMLHPGMLMTVDVSR